MALVVTLSTDPDSIAEADMEAALQAACEMIDDATALRDALMRTANTKLGWTQARVGAAVGMTQAGVSFLLKTRLLKTRKT